MLNACQRLNGEEERGWLETEVVTQFELQRTGYGVR